MAEFIVTNGNDSGTGSLRDAIAQANTLPGADEIRFDGVNIIDLTTGSLNITDTVTISGQNSHITVQRDSGATDFRIFNVTGGVTTTFDNLTIANGQTADSGAGINSDGAITLLNSNVTGNTSGDRGGGLYTRAAMITLTNSTVSNNSATDNGGGLYNRNSLVEITNSTVANNSSNRYGGGVHTRGQIIVADSTVSNNSSRRNGAGIYSRSGNITVSDSTISDNSSNRHGGGLWARSRTITLERSTVSGNSSRISAGGTYASTTNITESIISNNTSGDLGGGVYTTGALRITDSTISGNSSANKGGGVYFRNYAEILRSTISGNSSNRGGGLYSRGGGTVSISNSTISGNAVSNHGGGLFARGRNGGTITFFNATLTQNSAAGNGGGIFQNGGGLGLQNSIVAGNQDGTGLSPDISGSNIVGNNNNILGTVAGANNSTVGTGSDKVLSGLGISIATVLNPNLADNGGSTQTHALVDGSIAIDGAGAGATTEGQRQIGAVGTRDIGAFELRNQEINVTGNSVAIANNDTTPDTADDTDFGGVNVNSGSITKTFTIENQGDLPLGFAGSPFATITGTNAEDFTITDLAIASLTGRGSTTFQVTFDPSSVGTRTATVSFVTDDNDESPFTFAIQGEGTTGAVASSISAPPPLPGLAIAPPTINPPNPIQGFSSALAQTPFTITNPNSTPLNLSGITFSENSSIFSIFPTTATVNPGETATFFVQVADDILPGNYGAIATIPSPTGAPITFNLSATVSLPTAFQVAPIFEATLPSDTPIWTNGDDVLIGANIDGDGRQWINGGPGNDQIFGNLERDVLTGGTGDDLIFGGKGDDWIKGGEGNDTLVGDFGDDTLIGGLGSDRFIIGAGRGSDEILDYTDGIDGFLLESTVTFDQLALEAAGNSTQIKLGDELLVTVIGVERSLLDASDFATLG